VFELSQGVSRRDFIKGLVGGLIVGGIVGAAGGYVATPPREKTVTIEKTVATGTPKTQTVTVTETVTAKPLARKVPSKPIKLGVITVLTGPGAMLFSTGLKALEMEVEKINAQGGILGRKIKLIVRDSGGKPDKCIEHFKRLVTEEGVDYITVGATSAEACALAPIAEELGVLTLIQEGTATKLFEEIDPHPKYVFRIDNYDALDAISHAIAIHRTWPDARKFAVIGADYVWGHDEWNIITTVLKKLVPDMEIVAEAWPPLFAKDYSAHISKVLAAKPDVVELCLWGGDLVTCIKQGIGYGLFKQCRVSSVTGGEYIWGLGTECPEGILCSTRYYFLYPPWDRWPLNREFNEEFHRRYPNVRGGYPGFNCNSAYTAIHALKLAIEKAYTIVGGWPTTEEIISVMENLMVPTPGGYRYFRKEDHQMLGYAVSGLTKVSKEFGFAILDPVWVVTPEEMTPPPGVKWKEWVESWRRKE